MKKTLRVYKIIACVLGLTLSQNSMALECTSEGWLEGNPILTLSAEPIYKDGQLVALHRLSIDYVGPQTEDLDKGEYEMTNEQIQTLWADTSYKPRNKKDSTRFNLNSMEWFSENYGGFVHGLILPKNEAKIKGEFKAVLIASDDPYHDQIYTYYKLICNE